MAEARQEQGLLALTHKEAHFAKLILQGCTGVQAYRTAYDVGETTLPKTCYEQASYLRAKPNIAARCASGTLRAGRFGAMSDLIQRRAAFVYDAARLAAAAASAPIVPLPWSEREQDFKDQFIEVIERQCGPQRSNSPEELHGSWMQAYYKMGWVYGARYDRENRIHPDLVPYAQLGQLERDKDAVFVMLCEIARQWIYDLPEQADV